MDRAYNVLFLCTGNSARSIIAEALLNHLGKGKFHAYSAGSFPKREVNPLSLDLLKSLKLPTESLRSKSWDEFAKPDAPKMDFVFTVCDQAAGEICPIWPGSPMTAHWGIPDPAAAEGTESQRIAAFRDAARRLDARIKLFIALPFDRLDRLAIKREAEKIGRIGDTSSGGYLLSWRKPTAELVGTAFLLMAVVGSGIMGERLASGNAAIALLANSIATGAALYAIIRTFAPVSGAHFNPAVTLALASAKEIPRADLLPYIASQIVGAILGVWLAHLMFDLPILQTSTHLRTGLGQWAGEFIATFGLLAVIESGRRHFAAALPGAVALYIVAAYWFTSSTSFANPAVTLARALTDTFAGIAPAHVAGFMIAQALGAVVAIFAMRMLNGEPLFAKGKSAIQPGMTE